jgi:hypothetical protein
MSQDKGEGYVTIPRLAEYYRGGRVVGWGKDVPEEFRVRRDSQRPSRAP